MAVTAGAVPGKFDLTPPRPLRPAPTSVAKEAMSPCPAAVHAVVAVVAVDEVEVARATVDRVDAEAAGDLVVVAAAAHQLVVAEVADHAVAIAGAAVGDVVAAATVDQVGSRPAAEQVVAEAAEDRVVAAAAPDHVAFGRAAQHVVPVGADDLRPPPVAARFFDFFSRRHGRSQRKGRAERRESVVGKASSWAAAPYSGYRLLAQALRINFLLTNSSAPKRPSSRPKPERLKPPKGSRGYRPRPG